ncbi:MAG: diadenylate cyclase CdaA [bacterium]|nr:diadenylate cyclase CdaA [bacterium]
MNQELFKFSFLSIRPFDILDILLVATVFYYLWKLTHNTRAARMWFGILLLLAFGMVARILNLRALSWILASLSAFWAVAFVILFQPELRRALSDLGRTPFSRRRISARLPDILVQACGELSRRRWGAIILIRRKNPVAHFIETGIPIHSDVSSELLVNIFAPNTPLHDGCVIIDGDRVIAARCVLPVVEERGPLGMRHRAALAASQETDAVAVVVSEETGQVSIAVEGDWLLFRGDATEIPTSLASSISARAQ